MSDFFTTDEVYHTHLVASGLRAQAPHRLPPQNPSTMSAAVVNTTIPDGLLGSIQEALLDTYGGEIVVKQGERCGRIFVCSGKIAWVTCTSVPRRLREVLIDAAHLNEQDLDEVLQESKASGRGFAEILQEWDLLELSKIRECLLTHNAQSFQGIVSFGERMNSMFMPQRIKCSNEFLYSLEEIFENFHSQSAEVTSNTQTQLNLSRALVKVAGEIPGIGFIAIAERDSSQLVAKWPEDDEPEELRRCMKVVNERLVHNQGLQTLAQALAPGTDDNRFDVVMFGDDSLYMALGLGKDHFALVMCKGSQNFALGLRRSRSILTRIVEEAVHDSNK